MAEKVAIITDSSACIPRELVEKYSIQLVPMNVIFGDKTYQDGIDITPSEFYTLLRQAKELPATSHSSPGAYLEAYRRASLRADNILCVTLSSKFSGQFNSARVAMETAKDSLPGVTIKVLDCGTAAAAQGLVVLAAARAAASGQSLTRVIKMANSAARGVSLLAMVDTLDYLVKGGHVRRAAALAGSVLRIKPIFTLNEGDACPITNARTTLGAIKRMVKLMGQKIVAGQPFHVAVMHADALDEALVLRDQISSRFDCTELLLTEFTPVMGVHIGPGLIGVAFYCGD
jgi:DegV family protein with EDD domain